MCVMVRIGMGMVRCDFSAASIYLRSSVRSSGYYSLVSPHRLLAAVTCLDGQLPRFPLDHSGLLCVTFFGLYQQFPLNLTF